jgi:two-component system, LuxR family, response regulator FixJ
LSEATVFLVDDDPAELRTLTALIQTVFPRVRASGSIAAFLASRPYHQPACLVFDITTQGRDGIELYRTLMREKVALPVVFITGQATVPLAVAAMQLGAVNFLEKPTDPQRLWDSIRKALAVSEQSGYRLVRRQNIEQRLTQLASGEHEVLRLILEGKMNKEMATELGLSIRTIEDRRAKLMKKLSVKSLAELVRLVMSH